MRSFQVIVFVISFLFSSGVVAQTKPGDIPLEEFAALEEVSELKLSPDGKNYLFIAPYQGKSIVLVSSLSGEGEFEGAAVGPSKGLDIRWARWGNDEYVLVSMGYEHERHSLWGKQVETRLFSFPISKPKKLKNVVKFKQSNSSMFNLQGTYNQSTNANQWMPIDQDTIIDILPDDPGYFLLAIDEDWTDPAKEIRRVNVKTGKYRTIHNPSGAFRVWITDPGGNVRLGYGQELSGALLQDIKYTLTYRNPETTKWVHYTDEVLADIENYLVEGFYDDPRYAYLSARNESGHWALYKYDMIALEKVETLLSLEDRDVVDVIRDPMTRKVVGAYYHDNGIVYNYFDPVYKNLQRMIDGALPNSVNTIQSRTLDENRYIVFSKSDVDSGSYYLFDVPSKQLIYLEATYPRLDPQLMSPMRSITYTARDGLEIHGYLTIPLGKEAKNLPTVVLPHGGPTARDYWGFDILVQFLASRGYAVFQPNFRGSSGYGKEFEDSGRRQWGLKMQDDVTDGALWLIEEGIADPNRMCIVGISYGGYAALTATFTTPNLFECAVSVNGISNLMRLVGEESGFLGLNRWGELIGNPQNDKDQLIATSAMYNIDKIRTPILLIAAKDDTTVNYKQSDRFYDELKDSHKVVEYVELKDGNHSLVNEPAKEAAYRAIEKFLDRYIGNGS